MSQLLKLSEIKPPTFALRKDLGELEDLKNSMKEIGLLQPIAVRKVKGEYHIIFGDRRFRAAYELGWKEIEALIFDVDDKRSYEIALTENIARKMMEPQEEAQMFHEYIVKHGFGSTSELAKRIGKDKSFVSRRIDLLNLPESAMQALIRHDLGVSKAEIISHLPRPQAETATDFILNARSESGKEYSEDKLRGAVGLAKEGMPIYHALRVATYDNTPDFMSVVREKGHVDTVRTCRNDIESALKDCFVRVNDDINGLPDGEEKAHWISQVRYPINELISVIQKLKKEYGK